MGDKKMKLELCDICGEPTGNAGRMDDSLVCVCCDQTTCSNCGEAVVNQRDGDSVWVCNECLQGE